MTRLRNQSNAAIRSRAGAMLTIAVEHHAAVLRGVRAWMMGQREILKGVL